MQEPKIYPKIKVDHLGVTYEMGGRQKVNVLQDIDFEANEGSFVCILGPSGCGKSTLFNVIAGLISPTRGNIYLDGQSINGKTGLVGYMFQKDLLLPWRSIIENIYLGAEIQKRNMPESAAKAQMLVEKYGLSGFEDYYPKFLSGGMRQRAAFLRTMMLDNKVMLLDEPFGALDAQTRLSMQEWLHEVWRDSKKTIIFITHDVDEAIFLAEKVLVLSHRPSTILEYVDIPLPENRNYEMMGEPEIIKLRSEMFKIIRQESQKSLGGKDAGVESDPVIL
ncbi:ABC transporter ATP-binding protein [Ornatilinea apprima]|nr:ABC transporter ATP-binding protein [Ornatilinea apprima]